jgi:hypothetical protein
MIFVSRIQSKYNRQEAWEGREAAELIEGIEREGWLLNHMSESIYGNGTSHMACVFRRHDR